MTPVQLVVKTVNETGLYANALFKRAHEYAEVRVSKEFLRRRYLRYINHGIVPQIVEDYCWDLLSHRITK